MTEKTAALYSRLSSEDAMNPDDTFSGSIVSQKMLLEDFVKNHSELSGYRIIHFTDDGYSGTNFDRPAVRKMLDMAKKQQIDCIVVKDFSRFGRNYIDTGVYLEQIFPFLGIRFIAINDGFDSNYNDAAGSVDIGFKNIMHEHYAQSTSKKVSESKRMMTKEGLFIGAYSFFGYVKSDSDRHKLVIDDKAADIVKYIFKLRLEGMTIVDISRRLNSENISTPQERKKELCSTLSVKPYKNYWIAEMVRCILSDERYTGKMIYQKTKRKPGNTFERVKTSQEEWLCIDNAFEPIISTEDFQAVQSMKRVIKNSGHTSTINLFTGITIRCGICGRAMVIRNNGKFYRCNKSAYIQNAECRDLRIYKSELMEVISKSIDLQFGFADGKSRKESKVDSGKIAKAKAELQVKQKCRDTEIVKIYEKYKAGEISRDEFTEIKNKISFEADKAKLILDELYENARQCQVCDEAVTECMEKYKENKQLSNELLRSLIREVVVIDEGRVEIKWRFKDRIDEVL